MLRISEGQRIGSISGGCLEEDVLIHGAQVAAEGKPAIHVYDTTSENDLVWGAGQGCQGVVQVFLERLPRKPDWAVALAGNLDAGRSTELEVVWEASDPAQLGTRLAEREGVRSYTVPSAAEGTVYDLTPYIFRERIEPPPSLFVFGAGDDAQPLATLAGNLGWRVAVADPRSALVTAGRFPGARLLETGPAEALVGRVSPRAGSLAVVMTHQFAHDLKLLRELLPLPLGYLGLLGPRQRTDRILAELEAGGLDVTQAMRAALHAPVGLDLGANAPEEVALSIISEIQTSLSGRDARPLREKRGSIHA
jgi:xanthine/CO dehydrogenase XdhC/CoxF family maturation factor